MDLISICLASAVDNAWARTLGFWLIKLNDVFLQESRWLISSYLLFISSDRYRPGSI